LLAAARSQPLAGMALREALAAGADTGQVRAALALLAARGSRWGEAAAQAWGALTAAQGTFRHPFPGEFLTQALDRITLDGPPPLADSVMAVAVASRPGMARYRELRALAAVRAGSCDVAVSEFIEMLQFGIERQDGPALVRQCRAMGQASEARPAPGVVERRRGKGSN